MYLSAGSYIGNDVQFLDVVWLCLQEFPYGLLLMALASG